MVEREIDAGGRGRITWRLFEPQGQPVAAALLVPAMGVAQNFYAPLATWLAAQGFLAATFDFRGIGLSRRGSLRQVDADIVQWARCDCGAMVDALAERAGGKPLYWIGHSLGGQILPFVPNLRRVAKVVTVAAGSGYWRESAPRHRWRAGLLFFAVVPIALRTCGYFPGKRLRMVGDLPRGVMQQWRRWCLHPEYALGAEGDRVRPLYAAVTLPIAAFSFTDDEYMSARSIESVHGQYVGAQVTMKRIAPGEIGEKRIGHFGLFRPRFQESLWRAHLLPELR